MIGKVLPGMADTAGTVGPGKNMLRVPQVLAIEDMRIKEAKTGRRTVAEMAGMRAETVTMGSALALSIDTIVASLSAWRAEGTTGERGAAIAVKEGATREVLMRQKVGSQGTPPARQLQDRGSAAAGASSAMMRTCQAKEEEWTLAGRPDQDLEAKKLEMKRKLAAMVMAMVDLEQQETIAEHEIFRLLILFSWRAETAKIADEVCQQRMITWSTAPATEKTRKVVVSEKRLFLSSRGRAK